jgi:hypothetical protein
MSAFIILYLIVDRRACVSLNGLAWKCIPQRRHNSVGVLRSVAKHHHLLSIDNQHAADGVNGRGQTRIDGIVVHESIQPRGQLVRMRVADAVRFQSWSQQRRGGRMQGPGEQRLHQRIVGF